jgi:glycosyltransferase involved in cell wall biosynthesis
LGQYLEEPNQIRMSSPLRVVRIVADYAVGGKASYGLQPVYYNLSRVQALNGHEVHVIARRRSNEPSMEVNEGVTVHRVASPFTLNALTKLRELTGHNGLPNVVHTHSTSGVFLAATKRGINAPVVSHIHGTTYSAATPITLSFGDIKSGYSPWKVTISYMREKALWSAADRLAAVSTSVKSDLIGRYGIKEEKIRLVYNGVDAELFRPIAHPDFPERELVEGKKVVLYVGHFGLRKGVPFLIRAMKIVNEEVPDSMLVCVGGVPSWLPKGDYWSYLNGLVEQNGLKGKVILRDRVPNEALPNYYSMSDVFVLPSYYEAFPKVLIEAMACEKPAISSRMGGTQDSIEDGVNGFLVNYADPADIAKAIITLLQDEKRARRMGAIGRQRVEKDFTWKAVAGRFDSIYNEVTRN